MIKTINVWDSPELFDERVNAFEQEPKNSVFATQTHVNEIHTSNGTVTQYTAVIFYKVRL